jgi:hypothetical protein
MDTNNPSENEAIHMQEGGLQVPEDHGRPAEQILVEQQQQAEQPGLFVP